MSATTRRISGFLKALKSGIITDVPQEYQACESCRELSCDAAKRAGCPLRQAADIQEKSRVSNMVPKDSDD